MSSSAIQNISHNKYYNWLVRNLFSSWINTILTIIALIFVYQVGSFFLNWAIFDADFRYNFQGELITDRGFCSKNIMPGEYGACWAIIFARWNQFMYGLYPIEEAWRVNLIYALLPLAIIGILFDKIPFRRYFIYFTFIFPFLAYFFICFVSPPPQPAPHSPPSAAALAATIFLHSGLCTGQCSSWHSLEQ